MAMMDLVRRTRSYRRFSQKPLSREFLVGLVDLARLTASGGNQQPLKYTVVSDPATNAAVFPTLAWAGSLKDWDGPAPGERPTGHIVILHDTTISQSPGHDPGIAAQTIALGAMDEGVGCCMLGSVQRTKLAAILGLPEHLHIVLVLAFGYPGETIVLEAPTPTGKVTYYRDRASVHHVPKRPLREVLWGDGAT